MPTRSCIICRTKNEKSKLLRIVCDEQNQAIFDNKQKINKRAIYFCNEISCIKKAINMIEKGKLKTKIGINLDSLKVLLNDELNELGE